MLVGLIQVGKLMRLERPAGARPRKVLHSRVKSLNFILKGAGYQMMPNYKIIL